MKKIGIYLSVVFIVAIAAGAIYTIKMMQRPLGPYLALYTSTAVAPSPAEPTQAPAPTTAPPAVKTCGNQGKMSLFLVGQGKIEDGNLVKAGAIRLVVVDFDRVSATVLTLPSELWVDAAVLKDPAVQTLSLDMVYQKAYDTSGSVPQDVAHTQGTGAIAQAVLDTFGFVPDHYVTVLQEPFVEYVDDIGGIDFTLSQEIISEDGTVFAAGPHHLDGLGSLNFTRMDLAGLPVPDRWGRFERQNLIARALLDAVLKPENLPKIPDLIQEARESILTDLSIDQAMDLFCMVKVVGDEVIMLQVEKEMVTVDDQGRWIPDIEAAKDLISQMYEQ